jgi:Protein of unknown function (DUF2442)
MAEKLWKKEITEEAIQAQIQKAKAAWVELASAEPYAESVEFECQSAQFTIRLSNGVYFIFPSSLIQEIVEASPNDLADVHLSANGNSIHWDKLDVDFSISGLIARILGSKISLAELGRQGGKQTSIAKAEAAKQNGKKGGRPRNKTSLSNS